MAQMGDIRGTLLGANVVEARDLTNTGNLRPLKLESNGLDTIRLVLALAPVVCAERRGYLEREVQAMAE